MLYDQLARARADLAAHGDGRIRLSVREAEVVAFLADPHLSGFVNRAALPVDGGWLASLEGLAGDRT